MATAQWKIKAYPAKDKTKKDMLFLRISGDMDAEDVVKSAKACSAAVTNGGPWIIVADLAGMTDAHFSGAAAWREAFQKLSGNIAEGHVVTTVTIVKMITTTFCMAIGLKKHTYYPSWKSLLLSYAPARMIEDDLMQSGRPKTLG